MSATNTQGQRFRPYIDAERNHPGQKVIGFSCTPTQLASGSLSVTNNTQVAVSVVTTAAASDYGSASLNNATAQYTCRYAGLYTFTGMCGFASAADGLREVNIYNNTTTTVLGVNNLDVDAAAGTTCAVSVTAHARCAAGDVIIMRVFQNSGGAINATAPLKFSGVFLGQTGGASARSL